jgi:hypothetical protein
VRIQQERSLLQAREKAYSGNSISQNLDVELPSLQNCKKVNIGGKSMVFCYGSLR